MPSQTDSTNVQLKERCFDQPLADSAKPNVNTDATLIPQRNSRSSTAASLNLLDFESCFIMRTNDNANRLLANHNAERLIWRPAAFELFGIPGQTARSEASKFKRKLLGLTYNSLYFASTVSLSRGLARTKLLFRMLGVVFIVFLKNLHNWRSDP